ncbi:MULTISPECIES: hypothetical protein [Paenibacillus]|uniref:Uncharacterized protein n=1 Tax=Paenibacillus curdlanolyticus YK9 TaxID=717606 RepID=E0IEW7_9BACL|nr:MULTISPECIES: hypothetical protein [Paenibacillus]EFM09205.1 conserved hypothetical protein [Paenibacillus curdlanolyticus YK9]MWC27378.1 hypothetical protein [Paenibacillus sp. MMS18-CY102]
MTTKNASISSHKATERGFRPLVWLMTVAAWAALTVGVVLCLMYLQPFNDQNWGLMIGIGFLVGSVNIYVIRTAIHLVNERREQNANDQIDR